MSNASQAMGLLDWMRENNGYVFHRQVIATGFAHRDMEALLDRGVVRRRRGYHSNGRWSVIYVVTDMERVTPRHAALDRLEWPSLTRPAWSQLEKRYAK